MWPARLGLTKTLLLAGAVLLGLGYTPLSVANAAGMLVSRSTGLLWESCARPPIPRDPIKAAILNVTSDFEELAHLVSEFFRQPGLDPSVRQQFREFLAQRATRSFPRLESGLDWLLALYKFVFPFLCISMVAKLSQGGGEQDQQDATGAAGGQGAQPQRQPSLLAGTLRPLALGTGSGPAADGRNRSLSPIAPPTPVEAARQSEPPIQEHPASGAFHRPSSLLGGGGSKHRHGITEAHAARGGGAF
eukprot:scaffold12.g8295.t1